MAFVQDRVALIKCLLSEYTGRKLKARECNTWLYLCFVDLKKAYNSVSRDALWAFLRKRYRIPEKLLQIFKALHRDTRGAVHAHEKVSEEFPIKNGVRQRDVLPPTHFNVFDAVIFHGNGVTSMLWAEGVVQPRSGIGGEPKENEQGAVLACMISSMLMTWL